MLPESIYVWTGVNEVEVTSRGKGISDAGKLVALEAITGEIMWYLAVIERML